ncbi:MAG: thioredoxin family protein [Planctomycetota bacterium]|jgi:thioredoxin 1
MNKTGKIIVVLGLISAVVVAVAVRRNKSPDEPMPAEYKPEQLTGKGVPALVDLGSDKCIPCKMMAPVLEELRSEFAGTLQVNFLDVVKYPDLLALYGVRVIPTQILYDATGQELFRHEGFYSKEDILAKWRELGVELTEAR